MEIKDTKSWGDESDIRSIDAQYTNKKSQWIKSAYYSLPIWIIFILVTILSNFELLNYSWMEFFVIIRIPGLAIAYIFVLSTSVGSSEMNMQILTCVFNCIFYFFIIRLLVAFVSKINQVDE